MGLGFADYANQIEATKDTPYRLASVSKTFASTLILQLVEEGSVDLDDPVSMYGIEVPASAGVVTVKHVLSHTSDFLPGKNYRYDGGRFLVIGLDSHNFHRRSDSSLWTWLVYTGIPGSPVDLALRIRGLYLYAVHKSSGKKSFFFYSDKFFQVKR